MERIKSSGGRIDHLKDDNGNNIGPLRVWLKKSNQLGLGMSRSFGDRIASEIGVVSKPEIMEWYLTKEDKFIIIASDGIWEYMTSNEVVDLLKDFYLKDELQLAAEKLVLIASNRWKRNEGIVDDISLILIYFEK